MPRYGPKLQVLVAAVHISGHSSVKWDSAELRADLGAIVLRSTTLELSLWILT